MQTETQTIKAVHVTGYVRNKKAIEAQKSRRNRDEETKRNVGLALLVIMLIVLAIVFWKVTLLITVSIATVIILKKQLTAYVKQVLAESTISVYYMGSEVKEWHKKMIRLAFANTAS